MYTYITLQPDDGYYKEPKHVADIFKDTICARLLLLRRMQSVDSLRSDNCVFHKQNGDVNLSVMFSVYGDLSYTLCVRQQFP